MVATLRGVEAERDPFLAAFYSVRRETSIKYVRNLVAGDDVDAGIVGRVDGDGLVAIRPGAVVEITHIDGVLGGPAER
ncbi:MAG: hypothetical protein J07HX64_02133 [halophilic archaeon J07HX64]|nr:MAG: hypothetical protein J07HX64_02133 [halophilic archaeon J07HX64]